MLEVLAIDIGGTKIAAGILDAKGRLNPIHQCATPAREGGPAILRAVVDLCSPLLDGRGILVDHRPQAGIRVSPHFYTREEELSEFAEALSDRGENFKDITIALQGFGNVGSNAARLIAERGARIVAVADHAGGITNPKGLDIPALITWSAEHGGVKNFTGGEPFDGPEIITWDADVLIPAALEAAITEDNAAGVRAKIVVEAANAPTTPGADAILHDRGIFVIPDILANAGGVTVSYFEWTQNIQRFRWELDRINDELGKTMRKAYRAVSDTAQQEQIDMRTAAFVLAIRRVGQAALSRVYVNTDYGLRS